MIKITQNFLLTLVLAMVSSLFLPWWAVMVSGFLAAAIVRLQNVAAFFVPFLAILIFWVAYGWLLAKPNDFVLSEKIAVLLPLNGNVFLLLLITGIVGGLAAGIAALFGNQLRYVLSTKKNG